MRCNLKLPPHRSLRTEKGWKSTVDDVKCGAAQLGHGAAAVIDAPASPFQVVGIRSQDFTCDRMSSSCDTISEVGSCLWHVPGTAIDGLTQAARHTPKSISEGPGNAVEALELSFRHQGPRCASRNATEGYV